MEIQASIQQHESRPFYSISLTSKPPRKPREILAALLFNKPSAELTPPEKKEVEGLIQLYRAAAK